jgi:hypothetical protein
VHDGVVVAEGTPEELSNSSEPSVHQFIHSEPDGPVAFHIPHAPYTHDLALEPAKTPSACGLVLLAVDARREQQAV